MKTDTKKNFLETIFNNEQIQEAKNTMRIPKDKTPKYKIEENKKNVREKILKIPKLQKNQ